MPRINLLPIKAARRLDSARNELFAVLGVIGVVIALLFFLYTKKNSDTSDLEAKIKTVEAEIAILKVEVIKVEDLKKQDEKIRKKLQIVNRLIDNRTGPAKMLHELAMILTTESKRVWLTKMQHTGNNQLKLAGGAMDLEDVAEFQLALERRDVFRDVQLKRTSTSSADGVAYISWDLVCVTRFKAG